MAEFLSLFKKYLCIVAYFHWEFMRDTSELGRFSKDFVITGDGLILNTAYHD